MVAAAASAWPRWRSVGIAGVSAVLAINVMACPLPTAAAGTRTAPVRGHDVSFPQCSRPLPAPGAVAVVGVNGGAAFSANPCLASEFAWASHSGVLPELYMNMGDPGPQSPHWAQAGPRRCAAADRVCQAANYGAAAAADALARARVAGAHAVRWWLDIEVVNSWASDPAQNVAAIQGAAAMLRSRGATPGVYSTAWQWAQLTGGWRVAMPNWLGGAGDPGEAASRCGGAGFSGGPVQLVQYPTADVDGDVRCR
jgi:hypothetical protein